MSKDNLHCHYSDLPSPMSYIKTEELPEINLKLETKEIKSGIVYVPYIITTPPYMILSDKNGTRKIWTKNKYKIVLWFLYKITNIKWFIKKYNEQPR